ncbi:hypothetical protein JY96_05640 [Aquabacterium sp. NJ1]|nr:hypothetical protein JY96_05640 [Aquabacterium sp. NJ1]
MHFSWTREQVNNSTIAVHFRVCLFVKRRVQPVARCPYRDRGIIPETRGEIFDPAQLRALTFTHFHFLIVEMIWSIRNT